MRNYFNILRWKIVSVDMELKYQIIVLTIEFRKRFAKFMIRIDLFRKFLSSQSNVSVEEHS